MQGRILISPSKISEIVTELVRELKRKYGEISIDKLKYTGRKYIIYIRVADKKGKIIVGVEGNVRVYTGLAGTDISIKRILKRIISRHSER